MGFYKKHENYTLSGRIASNLKFGYYLMQGEGGPNV